MATPFNRVLITGCNGFIGSHLVEAMLAQGVRVLGIDNRDPTERYPTNHADFRFHRLDIHDWWWERGHVARFQPDMIVHLAALAGVRPSIASPSWYTQNNVTGTANMLEAAQRANCRHFIFASSSSVYGNNRKVPFAEDDPVDSPISPYAATKRAGELMCSTYAHLYGMKIASLRFFTVYGPRQRKDLAIRVFMEALARGKPITMYGDGSSSRDYTYIDDIIAGIMAASRQVTQLPDGTHRIWNLGSETPIALRDLIASIAQVAGREPQIERLPQQPGDVERTWADLTRARLELGYEPRTPLLEGLKRQWQSRTCRVSDGSRIATLLCAESRA